MQIHTGSSNNSVKIITVLIVLMTLSSFSYANKEETYSLKVSVKELRNSTGRIQFALYNKDDSIPDEHFEQYFRMQIGEISGDSSSVTFRNLPKGKYAISILHDENKNGEIDKGFILPVEGIGFSNYESIGLMNRPDFSGASFDLKEDLTINVKVIYM